MTRTIVPYKPYLKEYAKKLRNNSTLAEKLVWNGIKRRKLGYKFIRQKPLLEYIVDFYSPDLNIVIEIDGVSHEYKLDNDAVRDTVLQKHSIKVLRLEDYKVKKNPNGALLIIKEFIETHLPPAMPEYSPDCAGRSQEEIFT